MERFTNHLITHRFRTLFTERLGWDHASGNFVTEVDGQTFCFDFIAHKRGFQVIHCIADRYTLFNRRRLRALQKQLLKVAHEHIVIYSCDEPQKQVWQWAVRLADGRRIRHREHPFFSSSPPLPLLSRLERLRFTLAEEENITLIDALERVRDALDNQADLDLFVNKPRYAEQSDQLALAMQSGAIDDFHAFVLFHRPLAKWATKRLNHWAEFDSDDAEQIGMVAITRAAKKFRPELGFQFSTYATNAIHKECARQGPVFAFLIRIPPKDYWAYTRLVRISQRLDARSGHPSGTRFLERSEKQSQKPPNHWDRIRATIGVQSLSNHKSSIYKEVANLIDPDEGPLDKILRQSMIDEVLDIAMNSLTPDDATVIRLRYGLNCDPQTLQSVGVHFGVTKERIRQRQQRIEVVLKESILRILPDTNDAITHPKIQDAAKKMDKSLHIRKTLLDDSSPNIKTISIHKAPEITTLRLLSHSIQGSHLPYAH